MLAEPMSVHLRDCVDRQRKHSGATCRCPCHTYRTMADDLRDHPSKPDPTPHVHFHAHGAERHAHEHGHEGSAKDWHAHSTAEYPPPE